jgi:tetratricopeptide (TPR) repeat protein
MMSPGETDGEGRPRELRDCVALIRSKRYAEARTCLEHVLERDPTDVDTVVMAGEVCLALDDASAGARYFHRATQLDPNRADAFVGWGTALVRQGRPEQALWWLDHASQLQQDSIEPLLIAGRLLRSASEARDGWRGRDALREAEVRFARATERDTDAAIAWYELGLTRTERANIEGSCEAFARAAELDKTSIDARVRWGEALLRLERPTDAVEALKEALNLVRRQRVVAVEARVVVVEARLYLALALRQTRQFEAALEQLNEMLSEVRRLRDTPDRRPGQAESGKHIDGAQYVHEFIQWGQLVQAAVLADLKRYGDAFGVLRDAASLGTAVTPLVLHDTAALLSRRGDYAAAWQTLARADEALEDIPPDDQRTTLLRAELLRLKGRPTDARRLLEEELQDKPDDLDLLATLMRIAAEHRSSDQADRVSSDWHLWHTFEQVVAKIRPRQSRRSSALALGWLHLLVEEDDEAKKFLTEAVERDQNSAVARAYLGIALSRMGEHRQAAECLRAALRRDSDNLDIKLALAQTYAQLSSPEQAELLYREILAQAPATIEALVGLAAVLNNRDDGDVASYEEAEQWLLEASRLAATMELDLGKQEGSRRLTSRQLAALEYGIGYARVKQYESQTGSRISVRKIRLLNRAQEAFAAAEKQDAMLIRARRAKQRIEQSRLARIQDRAPLSLAALIAALLTLLTSTFLFEWPTAVEELTGSTYSVLTLGLVLLLIAVMSLPHVSKLSIAGGSLEKTTDALEIPLQFGIERDPGLVSLLRVDLGAPDMPTPESEASRQAREGMEGPMGDNGGVA